MNHGLIYRQVPQASTVYCQEAPSLHQAHSQDLVEAPPPLHRPEPLIQAKVRAATMTIGRPLTSFDVFSIRLRQGRVALASFPSSSTAPRTHAARRMEGKWPQISIRAMHSLPISVAVRRGYTLLDGFHATTFTSVLHMSFCLPRSGPNSPWCPVSVTCSSPDGTIWDPKNTSAVFKFKFQPLSCLNV